jgi:hypothetical protein
MSHGGKRKNAGRKSKDQEIKLIERLTPLADSAFEALEKGLKEQSPFYVKLWFEYFYGKPKQQIDHTTDGDKMHIPLIQWVK